MRFILIPLLLLIVSASQGQYFIRGIVKDAENETPLSYSSVYINNSTIGTVSNDKGEFIIGPMDPGNYELVASHIGFETFSYPFEITTKDIKLLVLLKPKANKLKDVIIYSEDARKKFLEIFRTYFLGITQAAEASKIENENIISFEKVDGALTATSDTPIIVTNNYLGYKIAFDLMDFYYHQKNNLTHFFGYGRFEEMKPKNRAQELKWIKNRSEIYKGSTKHFFSSLIDHSLDKDGFDVYINEPVSYNIDFLDNSNLNAKTKNLQSSRWRKVNEDELITKTLNNGNEYWQFTTDNKIRVRYRYNPAGKHYLYRQAMGPNAPQTPGTDSVIELLDNNYFIDKNGTIVNPASIRLSGYWAYEKLGNMLPTNYKPN